MLQMLDLFVVGEALWKKEVATKSTLFQVKGESGFLGLLLL
jgi:hypothetical protein